MSDGWVRLNIPRHNSINPFTMAGIAKDAGLTPEQFRELRRAEFHEALTAVTFVAAQDVGTFPVASGAAFAGARITAFKSGRSPPR